MRRKKTEIEAADSREFSIVRCSHAGVFFAVLGKFDPMSGAAELLDARKVWYWEGACAVEQLAQDGTTRPAKCKLTVTVPRMTVAGVVQIIPCTEKSRKCLAAIAEWRCDDDD